MFGPHTLARFIGTTRTAFRNVQPDRVPPYQRLSPGNNAILSGLSCRKINFSRNQGFPSSLLLNQDNKSPCLGNCDVITVDGCDRIVDPQWLNEHRNRLQIGCRRCGW